MSIGIGDEVIHNTFPPISGVVTSIQNRLNSENLIGVLRMDTGTVFWDDESTWDKVSNSTPKQNNEDVMVVEYQEVY